MNKFTLTLGGAVASLLMAGIPAFADGGGDWKLNDVADKLNTEFHEAFSVMTADGLTLYFSSSRPSKFQEADKEDHWLSRKDGSETRYDIYVTHRAAPTDAWDAPAMLPDTINTAFTDHSPSLSEDGHHLFFASDRPGGCGSLDIFSSYRSDVTDDQGWGDAQHLGCAEDGGANGPAFDSCPIVMDDTIYFTSSPTADLGTIEFKRTAFDPSTMTAGKAEILPNSTPYVDAHFDPHHGLIWAIYPEGGVGGSDLWQFENADSGVDPAQFVNPVAFAAPVNSPSEEHMPSATADGNILAFASDRPGGKGGMDIYQAEK